VARPPSDSRGRVHFEASLRFAYATTWRLACPPDQAFAQPTGTFTSGLSAVWSPAPPPDITTVATGQVPLAGLTDLHPLERQLASLQPRTGLLDNFSKLRGQTPLLPGAIECSANNSVLSALRHSRATLARTAQSRRCHRDCQREQSDDVTHTFLTSYCCKDGSGFLFKFARPFRGIR